jgi:hypothetical protein
LLGWKPRTLNHTTAIFRQVNKDYPRTHHDALEFPDGQMVLLTNLFEGQERRCFSFRRNLLQRDAASTGHCAMGNVFAQSR